jgi:HPt (histidine-containing phosphotransfer) domain-containing protein
MKLTFRFLLLIGALLLAVGASTLAGWQAISSLDAALARAVDNDMQRLLAITHARRVFRSMTLSERDHILAGSTAERDALAKKIASLGVELGTHLTQYSARMPDEDRPAIAAIQGARERWLELNRRVVGVANEDRKLALELSKEHQTDPVSWEAAIGKLVKLSEKRLAAQVQHTHQVARTARFTLVGVAGLAAALAAALGSVIFRTMARNLDELVALNADLEQRVQQRTVALAARERALRIVLDSTGDGLISVSLDGSVAGECSAAALTWFGQPRQAQPIWEFLLPHRPSQQLEFRVGFEQLAEDVMPWEVCAEQMPRIVEREGQLFELHFLRIQEGERLARILVRAQDITARVRSEQAEQASREQQTLIAHLVRDKHGFTQFVQECESLFSRLREDAPALELARNLHTLKGNAGMFGLKSVVEACHALEQRSSERGSAPRSEEILALWELWRSKFKSMEDFLWHGERSVLEVEPHEHASLIRNLLEHRDYTELLQLVERWTWQRTAVRLRRLTNQISYLAQRLDKSIEVEVLDNDVRVPEDYLEEFWPTLVHVINNAVDHGIESAQARADCGKSATGHIRIETRVTGNDLLLEISDDGRGIDRAALMQRARERGIELSPDATLEDLVFRDGLSSREVATELSGRGVGLAATKQACEAAGGSVTITSELGGGSKLSFRFRCPVVRTSALAAAIERRWSLAPVSAAH